MNKLKDWYLRYRAVVVTLLVMGVLFVASIIGVIVVLLFYSFGGLNSADTTITLVGLTAFATLLGAFAAFAAIAGALWIALDTNRREDRFRHEEVRAVIRVVAFWDSRMKRSTTLRIQVVNRGSYDAIRLRVGFGVYNSRGGPCWLTTHLEDGNIYDPVRLTPSDSPVQYLLSWSDLWYDSKAFLVIYYEDRLGWLWEQKAILTFYDAGPVAEARIPVNLEPPVHVEGYNLLQDYVEPEPEIIVPGLEASRDGHTFMITDLLEDADGFLLSFRVRGEDAVATPILQLVAYDDLENSYRQISQIPEQCEVEGPLTWVVSFRFEPSLPHNATTLKLILAVAEAVHLVGNTRQNVLKVLPVGAHFAVLLSQFRASPN